MYPFSEKKIYIFDFVLNFMSFVVTPNCLYAKLLKLYCFKPLITPEACLLHIKKNEAKSFLQNTEDNAWDCNYDIKLQLIKTK